MSDGIPCDSIESDNILPVNTSNTDYVEPVLDLFIADLRADGTEKYVAGYADVSATRPSRLPSNLIASSSRAFRVADPTLSSPPHTRFPQRVRKPS